MHGLCISYKDYVEFRNEIHLVNEWTGNRIQLTAIKEVRLMQETRSTVRVVCEVPPGVQVQLQVLHQMPDESLNPLELKTRKVQRLNSEGVLRHLATGAHDDEVRELFVAVAECSPELLRGVWSRLLKIVCADSSMWVYPNLAVYGDDEFEPAHIDREALALAWGELLQRARECVVTQKGLCS